jgi:hypothetical protein
MSKARRPGLPLPSPTRGTNSSAKIAFTLREDLDEIAAVRTLRRSSEMVESRFS